MHELSVALSIIEGAEEEASRNGGGRVCAVYVKLGALSGVSRDALLFSYELACNGTCLEGSRLVIEEVPIRIFCVNCDSEGDPVSGQCLRCARCGKSGCRLVEGTDLMLAGLELGS